MTYSAPLKVTIRLKIYDKDPETGVKSLRDMKEQEVFFGDIPLMTVGDHPSPATSNPLGTKGCGEAGCAGSLSTVVNAVIDALRDYGVEHIDMPLTSERIWPAIQDSTKTKAA